MRVLRTLAGLENGERALAIRALGLVAVIRLLLWVVPRGSVMRVMNKLERLPIAVPPETPAARMVWAVRAASRRVPGATCLTQSLALSALLARSGRLSRICLGVSNDKAEGFGAHAWVESGDEVYLSTPAELQSFSGVFILKDQSV